MMQLQQAMRLAAIAGLGVFALAPAAGARVIVVDGSIQAAVDAAAPGDRILVPPGTYTGSSGDAVVVVEKDGLTIQGSADAVIDATGFEYGIRVGPDVDLDPAGCPEIAVRGFTLRGLTVRNAEDTGVKLTAVEGFRLLGGTYLDNEEYGPFPVCSRSGRIALNFASGHADAAIYVGDSEHVAVRNNVVVASAIGIEIENSEAILVANNVTTGNTTGILAVALPGLPKPFTRNVLIRNNVVADNNLPNAGGGFVTLLPPGTGVLNVGGENVEFRNNRITGNQSVGLAILGNPFFLFDPRLAPFVEGNTVRNNAVLGNGFAPDPGTLVPGADLVFVPDVINPFDGTLVLVDPDPSSNCFAHNRFETEFPPGLSEAFACGPPGQR